MNVGKTALIQFSNRNPIGSESVYIKVDGRSLPTLSSVSFLGLTVDYRLRWEEHCAVISGRLASALFGIRSIKSSVSMESLKLFYFAYVESRIRYCIIFWGSSPHADRVFKMQKKIIRCMTNASRDASCRSLFKDLRILPLASVLIYELVVYYVNNKAQYTKNCDISNSLRTRHSEDIAIPRHRTHLYETSPHYLSILCYNKLPVLLKNPQNVKQFKFALKMFLHEKSFYSLSEYLYE